YEDQHVTEAIAWSKSERGVGVYHFPDAEAQQISGKVQFMTDDYLKKTAAAKLPGKEFLADRDALQAKYEKEYGK
ncbi:C4-dicarboxylate ABC transporter substrate-binding protein, partial [bacterium]|nr:C4-dicarboxylate ABC transporter substrate-binding protein [bacterium]